MSIPSSGLTQERQAYLLNTHAVVQHTKRSGLPFFAEQCAK
nr:MAG TPA: hypothetical protein [Caudoviricetes sp.]